MDIFLFDSYSVLFYSYSVLQQKLIPSHLSWSLEWYDNLVHRKPGIYTLSIVIISPLWYDTLISRPSYALGPTSQKVYVIIIQTLSKILFTLILISVAQLGHKFDVLVILCVITTWLLELWVQRSFMKLWVPSTGVAFHHMVAAFPQLFRRLLSSGFHDSGSIETLA